MTLEKKEDPYKDIKEAALKRANSIRRAFGLPPANMLEKGHVSDPFSCPITNTIKVGVDDGKPWHVATESEIEVMTDLGKSERRYKHSIGSKTFMEEFDKRKMPELILEDEDEDEDDEGGTF